VTNVKNQGGCASSWAFAAIGALECQLKRFSGQLKSLSVQQIVSCDKDSAYGCRGGTLLSAFRYAKNGIALEADYQYTSSNGSSGKCQRNYSVAIRTTWPYAVFVPAKSNYELMRAIVTYGSVSVAVCVDESFVHYKNGVFTQTKNCTWGFGVYDVLVVGFGTDSETGSNYYLIKNSWGLKWGVEGYARILRKDNLFLYLEPVYPMVF